MGLLHRHAVQVVFVQTSFAYAVMPSGLGLGLGLALLRWIAHATRATPADIKRLPVMLPASVWVCQGRPRSQSMEARRRDVLLSIPYK